MAAEEVNGTGRTWRVAMVGAGAIGNALLPLLSDLPIRRLTIIDGDRVEQHNLNRQPLFEVKDVGRSKAAVLSEPVLHTAGPCAVIAHDAFLRAGNAHALLRDHDLVLEGVDDLHAKALIDHACRELRIPLVSGAVHGQEGQVIVLHVPGSNDALTRSDLFRGPQGPDQDGCDMRAVALPLLRDVAGRMVTRAREIMAGPSAMNGRLEVLSPAHGQWMVIEPVA